jgi:hypothetical protein
METLPLYVCIVFGATALATVFLFFLASRKSVPALLVLLSWTSIQCIVSATGFYTITDTLPPRFIFLIGPALLFILILFATAAGRKWLDNFDAGWLTLLHTVRIPVEMVLLWLFFAKAVPELMTFEGRNFDILSGITAPVIYYFGYVKKGIGKAGMLIWNFICLGLLFNIVVNAILSAPFPFQQQAFDQPNIGVLHFPFTLLPGLIVPLVLFSHLVCIRALVRRG